MGRWCGWQRLIDVSIIELSDEAEKNDLEPSLSGVKLFSKTDLFAVRQGFPSPANQYVVSRTLNIFDLCGTNPPTEKFE